MITKFITYNELNTKELGLRLVDEIEFESSSHSMELVEIDGVNGAKIKDNKRLTIIERAFPFKIYDEKVDVQSIINKLNDRIINLKPGWYDFGCSWDSNYLYKAWFHETFKIEGSLTSKKKCILNFKLHPIKYLKLGLNKLTVTNGQILANPEKRKANPLIKLRGTGDINLNINSQIFRLKGVSGHIVIDCETQSAHWDNKEPQYDKVFTYPFPHLEIGDNRISWDNNSFVVEITPKMGGASLMAYPILYNANETNFEHLGVSVLSDASKCHVSRERNGIYILEFDYLVNGKDVDKIKEGMIVKVDAGYRSKNQRFIISKINKSKEIFKIYCQHISQVKTSLNAILPDIEVSGDGMAALSKWRDNLLDSRDEFLVNSDITTINKTVWKVDNIENARDALGGKAGSILDVWGGEYEFDNLNITLHKSMGIDNPTIIAYGKNLLDLEQEQSILETYTSVFPFKKYTDDKNNEVLLTLPELLVDSRFVNNFTHKRILKVDFSNDENIKTVEQLRNKANSYIKSNNVGVPKTNLKIEYQDLSKVDGVFSNPALEEVDLCDRLKVYYSDLGIMNESAKVVKVVWDVINEENYEIEVGDSRTNFSDGTSNKIESLQNQTSSLVARINALVSEQEKVVEKYIKEKSKAIEDAVKEGVEKSEILSEEKVRKLENDLDSKLTPIRDEISKITEDMNSGLNEKIKENLKNLDIDNSEINELKRKVEEVSEVAETTLQMVGTDETVTYNKNRLDGDTEREIPLGTPFIEVSHNGKGFEVGKPYVISWEATCRVHDSYDVKFLFNRPIFFPIRINMIPSNTLYPNAEKTFNSQEGTIFSVYNGQYAINFDSKWYKIQNFNKNIISATTVNVVANYKEIAEGVETADYQGEWNETPNFILDGGGN